MGIFTLTKGQLSSLGLALLIGIIIILSHSLYQTSWVSLFSDRESDRFELQLVQFVDEVPIADATVVKLLHGLSPAPVLNIKVENYWKKKIGARGDSFRVQLGRVVKPEHNRIGFYVDFTRQDIAHLKDPTLFLNKIYGDWHLYLNGIPIRRGKELDRYIAIRLPAIDDEMRLTWVVDRSTKPTVLGFSFLHGLSIRSAAEASWAQRTLPMQHQLPRIIASVFFLAFCLVSIVLAVSMPKYTDLWAFAAFCGAMFFAIWGTTPFYWESYDFQTDEKYSFVVAKLASFGFVVVTGAALSLSFFRISGYFLWLILTMTVGWIVGTIGVHWPFSSDLPLYKLTANANQQFVRALLGSQTIIFFYGFYTLFDQIKTFRRRGLEAMIPPMKRRLAEASVFLIAMGLMVGTYLMALPLQSTTSGPDLFLMFALLPAATLFIQFYWMMGSSTRFRERLYPQLDYVDYLVMEFKDKALDQTYVGTLAAFDVKGFKRLTALKVKSDHHRKGVERLVGRMQSDISRLVGREHTVFRYKSNGDEWLYALYAKDAKASTEILCHLVDTWYAHRTKLLDNWKNAFQSLVGEMDEETAEVIASLDLHVMFCRLKNMRINVEDGRSRPDYTCDSFTLLTPAFKASNVHRVAMYRDEAELMRTAGCEFFPLNEATVGLFSMNPKNEDDTENAA